MTVHFAEPSSILVKPNRQRKAFDEAAIQELSASITANTLLQAPVCRREGGRLVLVAGERRLRAMTDIVDLGGKIRYGSIAVPNGLIPYTDLGELSPLAAWEAELEENIRRVDLSWQERAAATAALMELRTQQAAEADRPAPTTVDIAREIRGEAPGTPKEALGFAPQQVRDELIVSRFLTDPEVAAASSPQQALKILKKREEREKNAQLAAKLGAVFSSGSHRLLNEDSLTWMAAADAGQFDIILTDPPYGMGADSFGDSGTGGSASSHFYEDSYEVWSRIMAVFPRETFRLAREGAHAYVFCDFDRFAELRELMAAAGWRVHRTPLIWSNPDGFRAPWPEHGPQRRYELILYAVKGDFKVNAVKSDVLEYRKDKSLGHPAQKPVPLLIDLLSRSAKAGSSVFDPFAGSGGTLEAADELKLPSTCIELDAAAYGIAATRLAQLKSQIELPL